jgi:NTP pyrophosphatase (non-canonical NTP hydrolase)
MTDTVYLEKARRTLSTQEDVLGHMVIGLSTESNELLDAYKKHKFYGRELDKQNVREEIGDLMWYLIQLCDEVDYSLDQAKVDNISKLEKRYPEKFIDVVVRDQEVELNHIKD